MSDRRQAIRVATKAAEDWWEHPPEVLAEKIVGTLAALPAQPTDDRQRALTALQDGCRERGLDVKGDGDWEQMVRTVLQVVDNNRVLRNRLQELTARAAPSDDRVREAAREVVGAFFEGYTTARSRLGAACVALCVALDAPVGEVEITDEMVERARAVLRQSSSHPFALTWSNLEAQIRPALRAALVTPTPDETILRCGVCGGRGWHTAGGNDPMACGACPAGAAFAGEDGEHAG